MTIPTSAEVALVEGSDDVDFGENDFPIQPEHPAGPTSTTVEWIFTSVQFALAATLLVVAVLLARRFRSPWPLMCVLGGFLTGFIEPLLDVGLQVYWTDHDQPSYVTGFGREVPLMTLAAYTYLMGFSSMMIWLWSRRGSITKRKVLALYVGMIAAVNTLEPLGIHHDMWFYAGQQGVRFFEYPVWYSVSVASIFVMNGAIQYRAMPYLSGWRIVGVVMLIPMIDVGLVYATGWPMFMALNHEPAMAITYLCNVWAIVQGFIVVYLALALIGLVQVEAAGRAHAEALAGTGGGGEAVPSPAHVVEPGVRPGR